jgi:hypothetical protein
MTHRSEYFAGQTESSVAVNAEVDPTAGGWAIAYEQVLCVHASLESRERTIAVVRSKVGDTCTQIFHITTSLQKAPRQEVVSRDSSIVQMVGSVTPGADLS